MGRQRRSRGMSQIDIWTCISMSRVALEGKPWEAGTEWSSITPPKLQIYGAQRDLLRLFLNQGDDKNTRQVDLKAHRDREGSRQKSVAHHQQPQQPHPDHSPPQTFSRASTTLFQEKNGQSSCGSFSHRYKAMSHCNPCTESNCYQFTTGQLQREVTETY